MKTLFETLCTIDHLKEAWKIVFHKKSSGGIDKVTIADFASNAEQNITRLCKKLRTKEWKPQPYMSIMIPKKDSSLRELGILSIEDKIVQQAIKMLIEPVLEKIFYTSSYAYRPGRGHLKAVRRTFHECHQQSNIWYLRLDIDNFFDNIDHNILFSLLNNSIKDAEICRLIELSVLMGIVDGSEQWSEKSEGIPQGAVLSPLLANLYATSFDQFIKSFTNSYVRYADDFIIWCNDEQTAKNLLERIDKYLEQNLKLKLNTPNIGLVAEGFEFLGITFNNKVLSISELKRQNLSSKIQNIEIQEGQLSRKYIESLTGIERYYAGVLPQIYLDEFKDIFYKALSEWINKQEELSSKELSRLFSDLPLVRVIDKDYKKMIKDIYKTSKHKQQITEHEKKNLNKKIIRSRKLEYQRRESDNSELVVASHGYFIGKSNRGITLRKKGTPQPVPSSSALKHITILSEGVTISSNAITFCMDKGIPIDFFDRHNQHIASIISPKYLQTTKWNSQNNMQPEKKIIIAKKIIEGKLKNQINLIKYFHKYHKGINHLDEHYRLVEERFLDVIQKIKKIENHAKYKDLLMSYEAQGALVYWDYIKALTEDDNVGFEGRIKQGAKDLVNSMLNYGYSIIYPRIWQSLLRHKLNPYIGFVHYQEGNPNLVFDMIELFRSQAVDRVVISMVQKKEKLELREGRLEEHTRSLLAKNIYERLNRYEKYRGKECRFMDIIDLQVKEILDYIDSDITYRPYIAKW